MNKQFSITSYTDKKTRTEEIYVSINGVWMAKGNLIENPDGVDFCLYSDMDQDFKQYYDQAKENLKRLPKQTSWFDSSLSVMELEYIALMNACRVYNSKFFSRQRS